MVWLGLTMLPQSLSMPAVSVSRTASAGDLAKWWVLYVSRAAPQSPVT